VRILRRRSNCRSLSAVVATANVTSAIGATVTVAPPSPPGFRDTKSIFKTICETSFSTSESAMFGKYACRRQLASEFATVTVAPSVAPPVLGRRDRDPGPMPPCHVTPPGRRRHAIRLSDGRAPAGIPLLGLPSPSLKFTHSHFPNPSRPPPPTLPPPGFFSSHRPYPRHWLLTQPVPLALHRNLPRVSLPTLPLCSGSALQTRGSRRLSRRNRGTVRLCTA
jgi:hypothetical protein